MTSKFLAAGSVALMGAGSLFGASAAQAATVADCGTFDGATVSLLDGGVCDVVFDATGAYEFAAPDGVIAVEAILVGGGGGGHGYDDGWQDNGYGGTAGEVVYLDEVATDRTVDVLVADGGGGGYADGSDGVVDEYPDAGADTTVDITVASGGESVTEFSPYTGEGANSDNPDRNSGFLSSDPELVGPNNPLFPEIDGDIELGMGGIGLAASAAIGDPVRGGGGNANGVEGQDGADGTVILRYLAPGLAATGVDANSIGLVAGALGLGGVALAVVASARRARRSK